MTRWLTRYTRGSVRGHRLVLLLSLRKLLTLVTLTCLYNVLTFVTLALIHTPLTLATSTFHSLLTRTSLVILIVCIGITDFSRVRLLASTTGGKPFRRRK